MVDNVEIVNGVAELNVDIGSSGDYLVTANAGCDKKVNLSVEVISDGSSVDDGYALGSAINTLVNATWLYGVIFYQDITNGNLVFGANDENPRTDDFIVCEYKGETYHSISNIGSGDFDDYPQISIPVRLFDSDDPTLMNFTITRGDNSVSFSLYDVDIYNNVIELHPISYYDSEDTPVDPDPVEPEWTKIADMTTSSAEWDTAPLSDGYHVPHDTYGYWNELIPNNSTVKITGTSTTSRPVIEIVDALSNNSNSLSIHDASFRKWGGIGETFITHTTHWYEGDFVIYVTKNDNTFTIDMNGDVYTVTNTAGVFDGAYYLRFNYESGNPSFIITDVRYSVNS